MDSLKAFGDEAPHAPAEEESRMEAPPEIGVDERRMHVRAYNHWVSLLKERPYPSIRDLDHRNIGDFGPHSVLLDFTGGRENPALAYVGAELRAECALDDDVRALAQVPGRSLLSRLTDHYLQIIANEAPIGFEAEFVNHRGNQTMYRGILMPFSAGGERIDFIYGVINWKELVDGAAAAEIARQVDGAVAAAPPPADCPVWADGPNAERDTEEADTDAAPGLWDPPGPDAGLGDRLAFARDCAAAARTADQRGRAALYRALGHAHDFACAAAGAPEDYAELLADAGIKTQARAPMTAIAKLVFGAGYDKTRLTEFAAALAFAAREGVPAGGFEAFIEGRPGGLKALVQAERAARRPAPRPDAAAGRRAALDARPVIGHVDIAAPARPAGELLLLVARQEEGGRLAILAPVGEDAALLDRAIARAG